MSISKIRIKIGEVEIDYEGSEEFLKADLPNMLEAVLKIVPVPPPVAKPHSAAAAPGGATRAQHSANQSQTVSSIAAKLGVKSGPELVKAAAYRMVAFGGNDVFSRTELTKEMRAATQYFKESYGKNLSGTLDRLVADDVLLESSPGMFALQADAMKAMNAALSG
jgi:hypothetical protein